MCLGILKLTGNLNQVVIGIIATGIVVILFDLELHGELAALARQILGVDIAAIELVCYGDVPRHLSVLVQIALVDKVLHSLARNGNRPAVVR